MPARLEPGLEYLCLEQSRSGGGGVLRLRESAHFRLWFSSFVLRGFPKRKIEAFWHFMNIETL